MTYWTCSVVSVVFSVGLVLFYRARRFLRWSYTSILALVVFSISSTQFQVSENISLSVHIFSGSSISSYYINIFAGREAHVVYKPLSSKCLLENLSSSSSHLELYTERFLNIFDSLKKTIALQCSLPTQSTLQGQKLEKKEQIISIFHFSNPRLSWARNLSVTSDGRWL